MAFPCFVGRVGERASGTRLRGCAENEGIDAEETAECPQWSKDRVEHEAEKHARVLNAPIFSAANIHPRWTGRRSSGRTSAGATSAMPRTKGHVEAFVVAGGVVDRRGVRGVRRSRGVVVVVVAFVAFVVVVVVVVVDDDVVVVVVASSSDRGRVVEASSSSSSSSELVRGLSLVLSSSIVDDHQFGGRRRRGRWWLVFVVVVGFHMVFVELLVVRDPGPEEPGQNEAEHHRGGDPDWGPNFAARASKDRRRRSRAD